MPDFAEPVWECQLMAIALSAHCGHGPMIVRMAKKDIKIPGMSLNAGIDSKCVCTTNEKRDLRVLENREYARIQCVCLGSSSG